MKFAQQLLLLCLAGAALGCGQKGPLVMPDQQKHKRSLPTVPGAAKPSSGNATPAPQDGGTPTNPAPSTPAQSTSPAQSTPPAPTPPSSGTPPPAAAVGR